MEENYINPLHEEAQLIQSLVDLLDATWTNANPRYINKKVLEYQEQRRICVACGVNGKRVKKHDARALDYIIQFNSCPIDIQ